MTRSYTLIIVLLVLNLIGGFGLWYGYTSILDKKTEESNVRAELSDETEQSSKLKTLQRTFTLASAEEEKLLRYMFEITDEGKISFISRMEQLGASTTGATLETKSLNFINTEPKSFHGEFSLRGRWVDLYHVLRLTEEFPAKIVIKRFDARGEAGENWDGTLSLDVTGLHNTK